MHQQLMNLIDTQNNEGLIDFLQENPEIDLQNISASGVSALWWALTPPSGTEISLAIVDTLLQIDKVDPLEAWEGLRPRWLNNRALNDLLNRYEANFVRDEGYEEFVVDAEEDEEEKDEDNLLLNLGSDDQNVHDPILVRRYDYHVACLFNRYVSSHECHLTEFPSDLDTFIQDYFSKQDIESATGAIRRCRHSSESRSHSNFSREKGRISYNNMDLIKLIWHALNDRRPESYVSGLEFDSDSILKRKKLFIEHLIATQNEYGNDSPACFMGTRSKLITALEHVHLDCAGDPPYLISKEHLEELYQDFCGEAITKLQQENPKLYGFFLGTLFEPTTDVDRNTKSLEPELNNWENKLISEFYSKTKKFFEKKAQTPKDITKFLAPYTKSENPHLPLNIVNNELARLVSRCAQKISILNWGILATENIKVDFSSIPAFKSFIFKKYVHVTPATNAAFKDIFISYGFEGDVPEPAWRAVIEQIFLGNTINLGSIFMRFYSTQFEFGPWKEWYKQLPNSFQKAFFKLFNKTHDIQASALQIALDSGCWEYYSANENNPLVFKQKDLRGHNFTKVNLQYFTFVECDLRLTGITQNLSEKPGAIINSVLDVDALHSIIKIDNIQLFSIIYPYLTTEQKIDFLKESERGESLFEEAIRSNKPNIPKFIKIILSDEYFASEDIWTKLLRKTLINTFSRNSLSLNLVRAYEEALGQERILELLEVCKHSDRLKSVPRYGAAHTTNNLLNLGICCHHLDEILFINNTSLLILAVKAHDLSTIKFLLALKNKELLYFLDLQGHNVLSQAILSDNYQAAALILSIDNSYEFVHSYSKNNMLPLYLAAQKSNLNLLQSLLNLYQTNNFSLSADEYINLLKYAAINPHPVICELVIAYGKHFRDLNQPIPLCNGYLEDLFPESISGIIPSNSKITQMLARGHAQIGRLDGLVFWVGCYITHHVDKAVTDLESQELKREEPIFYYTLKLHNRAKMVNEGSLMTASETEKKEITFDFLRLIHALIAARPFNCSQALLNVFVKLSDNNMKELAASHVRNSTVFDRAFKYWFMREMQGLSKAQGYSYNPMIASFSNRFFPILEMKGVERERVTPAPSL